MLDKIYIFIALIVGIVTTIVLIAKGASAADWAGATFWAMICYLIVGLILRNYLKKNVFIEKAKIKSESNNKDENVDVEDDTFFVENVEKAFFDDGEDE
ncbi:MAG: hypothetical protein ACK5LY_05740 [Lachnospirales bacterium]